MFAVIQTGGKQYKVAKNMVIKVEKIKGEQGSKVELSQVLMIGESSKPSFIGTPMVKGAVVTAEILNHSKESKILVFKKKRRQNYRRMAGHRRQVTELKILDIVKKSDKSEKISVQA
jgi:large subunit ribosomal protein L21